MAEMEGISIPSKKRKFSFCYICSNQDFSSGWVCDHGEFCMDCTCSYDSSFNCKCQECDDVAFSCPCDKCKITCNLCKETIAPSSSHGIKCPICSIRLCSEWCLNNDHEFWCRKKFIEQLLLEHWKNIYNFDFNLVQLITRYEP